MNGYGPEGPYICYDTDGNGQATFVRRCTKCFRFVTPDAQIFVNEETGLRKGPNATCKKCGRTEMDFVGFL